MNVVGSHVDCQEFVSPMLTYFTYCLFHDWTLIGIERHGLMLQSFSFGTLQTRVRCDAGSAILVLFAIDGPSFVTVKPSSVRAK